MYLAELQRTDGILKIYATASASTPLLVRIQPGTHYLLPFPPTDTHLFLTRYQQLSQGPPLVHVYPETLSVYPSPRMAVSIRTGGNLPVTTYVPHLLAGNGESYSDPSYTLASSGVWSADGTDFFIVWMDGLISKISLPAQVQI